MFLDLFFFDMRFQSETAVGFVRSLWPLALAFRLIDTLLFSETHLNTIHRFLVNGMIKIMWIVENLDRFMSTFQFDLGILPISILNITYLLDDVYRRNVFSFLESLKNAVKGKQFLFPFWAFLAVVLTATYWIHSQSALPAELKRPFRMVCANSRNFDCFTPKTR